MTKNAKIQESNMDMIVNLKQSVELAIKVMAELTHENAELKRQLALRPLRHTAAGDGPITPEDVFYHTGQRFRYLDEQGDLAGDTYLLAQVEAATINLINMTDGNRWTQSMVFHNPAKVPKSAFDKLFAGGANLKKWVALP